MIAIDSETTGLDFYHGAAPYFVTICKEDGTQHHFEWDVDPLTRKVNILEEDKWQILKIVEESDGIVGQNVKFDIGALYSVGMFKYGDNCTWPWEMTDDTLLVAHLFASNQSKTLTDLAIHYLGIDIEPYEVHIKGATQEARRKVRSEYPKWRIASDALPEMPSAKGECWKYDMWLPRAYALRKGYPKEHPWMTSLRDYSNADSAVTLALWKGRGQWHGMETELKKRDLWEIYLTRRKLIRILFLMEHRGLTVSKQELARLEEEYICESNNLEEVCRDIANGYRFDLTLPKGGVNNSLRNFLFEVMRLPPIRNPKSKTLTPSLDKNAIDHYISTLPQGVEGDNRYTFISCLRDKRKRDTAVTFLRSYRKFWLPLESGPVKVVPNDGVSLVEKIKRRMALKDWYVLHPSFNLTGTDTLRMSSSSPNSQQISKLEGFNLRKCFGPSPGREWWSLDAKNLELRIPAYEAGEKDMIEIFEKPNDPPYFGSYHLLIFDLLHPQLFKEHGKKCKDIFESTWYQWVKNGNFAVLYGCQETKADDTYHVKGAYKKIRHRFPRIAALADSQIAMANRLGYVETIPDKALKCQRGYPILCTRSEYGKVLPTVPLNYHIQSSACYWMGTAMLECQDYLDQLNNSDGGKSGYYMILNVHDELVFDFPKKEIVDGDNNSGNLAVVREIKRRMEKCGDRIGVPTPVSCELHRENWSVGVSYD